MAVANALLRAAGFLEKSTATEHATSSSSTATEHATEDEMFFPKQRRHDWGGVLTCFL